MTRRVIVNRAPMDAPLGTRLASDRLDWTDLLVRIVSVGVVVFSIGMLVL